MLMLSFALLNLDANIVFDSPEGETSEQTQISHAIYLRQLPREVGEHTHTCL